MEGVNKITEIVSQNNITQACSIVNDCVIIMNDQRVLRVFTDTL